MKFRASGSAQSRRSPGPIKTRVISLPLLPRWLESYGYGHSKILFKPTKIHGHPFHPTAAAAMSYFVVAANLDARYKEDVGFVINGGKSWSSVKFTNHIIDLNKETAISMGCYKFANFPSTVNGKTHCALNHGTFSILSY